MVPKLGHFITLYFGMAAMPFLCRGLKLYYRIESKAYKGGKGGSVVHLYKYLNKVNCQQ